MRLTTCNPQRIDTRTVPVQGTYYQFTPNPIIHTMTHSYNDTKQSILSWKCYPEQFQKPHNLYKLKLTTSTRSHANKNKHKKDNWFRERFGQNLSSQITRNSVSEHQDFKIFWGIMPPDPPTGWPPHCSPDSSVIKKQKNTILYTKKVCLLSVLTWYPLNEKISKVR